MDVKKHTSSKVYIYGVTHSSDADWIDYVRENIREGNKYENIKSDSVKLKSKIAQL